MPEQVFVEQVFDPGDPEQVFDRRVPEQVFDPDPEHTFDRPLFRHR